MCTLIGLAGRVADPFLASTSDNPYSTRNFVAVKTPEEGFRYIGTFIESLEDSVPWNGALTRGLNSQGFAFTYSYVEPAFVGAATEHPQNKPGVGGQHPGVLVGLDPPLDPVVFSKGLIANCSSTEDAIRYLAGGAPAGATGNYLLLDSAGNFAVVEVSTHESIAVMSQEAARTNTWLAPKMPEYAPSIYSSDSSRRRLERAQHLLKQVSSAQETPEILKDHKHRKEPEDKYGASICNHGLEHGTVSSEIMMPTKGSFFYAYGQPCGRRNDGLASWSRHEEFRLDLTPDGPITSIDGTLVDLTEA
jgi:hypothetical protein